MSEEGYTCMNGSIKISQLKLSALPLRTASGTYTNDHPERAPDSYLTPTSPDRVLSSLPAFPPSRFDRSQSIPQDSVSLNTSTTQLLPRADSGFGSESYPRSPVSSVSTTLRQSTVYEYIDPHYDRLNEKNIVSNIALELNLADNHNCSGTSYVSATPSEQTATYHDVGHDTDDVILTNPTRRRANPMYGALDKSATRMSFLPFYDKQQAAARRQLCLLWFAFIVTFFISIALLAVVLYLLFGLVPSLRNDIERQEGRIQKMEAHSASFSTEGILKPNFLAENQSVLSTSVLASVVQLNMTVWSLSSELRLINASLQDQISNISLKPGPQGESGAGNFSTCTYSNRSSLSYHPSPETVTDWEPAENVLQTKIVLFASCSVEGGTEQSIETNVISVNAVQYRCRCNGQKTTDTRQRRCTIHWILCDRFSSPADMASLRSS